jgi:hypothetical protein
VTRATRPEKLFLRSYGYTFEAASGGLRYVLGGEREHPPVIELDALE